MQWKVQYAGISHFIDAFDCIFMNLVAQINSSCLGLLSGTLVCLTVCKLCYHHEIKDEPQPIFAWPEKYIPREGFY